MGNTHDWVTATAVQPVKLAPTGTFTLHTAWRTFADVDAAKFVSTEFGQTLNAEQRSSLVAKINACPQHQLTSLSFVLTPSLAVATCLEVIFYKPGNKTVKFVIRRCQLAVGVSKVALTRTTRDGVLRQTVAKPQALNSYEIKQVGDFMLAQLDRQTKALPKIQKDWPAAPQDTLVNTTIAFATPPPIRPRPPPPPPRRAPKKLVPRKK